MTTRRLTAVDAQTYWMSATIPNDQFLLYAFGPADLNGALSEIRARAQMCAALCLRIADDRFWTYPQWVSCGVGEDQIVVHDRAEQRWTACLAAVGELMDDQLDPQVMAWRLHVFPVVDGVPGTSSAGSVAVLQICHALGDGARSSDLAGYLFGRAGTQPAVVARRLGRGGLARRAFSAGRGHRTLVRETAAGLVPAQAISVPVLRTNSKPSGARQVRTVVCERGRLPGPTVTVGVLAVVSAALSGHLRALGDEPSTLAAEIPMAKPGPRVAHNHFGNVGVGLHPDVQRDSRTSRIAAELHQRRRRASHPAMRAEAIAFASVPAALLRWGVAHFDPDVPSPTVTGNTVVSSVNRGPKDLRFGGAPVVLTAGFPGLSPMMGVTHGVHGIGDTVAVSVHAAESALPDVDGYVERIKHELLD